MPEDYPYINTDGEAPPALTPPTVPEAQPAGDPVDIEGPELPAPPLIPYVKPAFSENAQIQNASAWATNPQQSLSLSQSYPENWDPTGGMNLGDNGSGRDIGEAYQGTVVKTYRTAALADCPFHDTSAVTVERPDGMYEHTLPLAWTPLAIVGTLVGVVKSVQGMCWYYSLRPSLRYGKVTNGYGGLGGESGGRVTVTPCDIDKTVTGAADVLVYLKADQSDYTMYTGTIIAVGTLIPYVIAESGSAAYALGTPKVGFVDWWYDYADTETVYLKFRDDWGTFCGTDSDWIEDEVPEDCTPLISSVDNTSWT
jgi:hypothetical protein